MRVLDEQLFNFFYSLSNRSGILDGFLIFCGKYLVWFIILFAVAKLFRRKNWNNDRPLWGNRFQYFSLGLIAVLLSRGIVANLIQSFLLSPRPFAALEINPLFNHMVSNSMPSGHMAALIPIALTLMIFDRKAGWWATLLVLVVGLARIAAGVHWPMDILMGLTTGILSFFLVYSLFRKKKLL